MKKDLIEEEQKRQQETLQMIAAENITSQKVLMPLCSQLMCKTAEGEIGKRYHMGCGIVDEIEKLAEDRLKKLFNSKKVWVQPHSGSTANQIVIFSLLDKYLARTKNARILSMGLNHGGHLTHGSIHNISGKLFSFGHYFVDKDTYLIDYDMVAKKAEQFKPHIIICGASSYPREIDFKRFGRISEQNNAYLLSDIAHIFGLIVGGMHQSPTKHSTYITSSTYKAGGPRGGVIIAGNKSTDELNKRMTTSVFPGVQSTPDFSEIASKSIFFGECQTNEYCEIQRQIVKNAKILASELKSYGYDIITGGTDNHMILVNIKKTLGITGMEAEKLLGVCGINANRNVIPYDTESPLFTSGIRFGTNTITRIGMKEAQVKYIASLIHDSLQGFTKGISDNVKELMKDYSVII